MKIAVFVDGSNLYCKLKELKIKNTSQFDYFGFIKSLTKTDKNQFIGYYVGQIRKEKNNPKSQELYANQQKLFAHLKKNIPNISIICGHIQNFNGVYKEKGVDVRLALDIYRLGKDKIYNKAILLSSDSDLIPAIKLIQRDGKEIEYIGFSHNPSIALIKECKSKKLLNANDLKAFELRQQRHSSA